jgi:hypothetical protein
MPWFVVILLLLLGHPLWALFVAFLYALAG